MNSAKRRSCFVLILLSLFACKQPNKAPEPSASIKDTVATSQSIIDKDSILLNMTKIILTAFKEKKYSTITQFLHPSMGIRFSPYAFISTDDRVFTIAEFDSVCLNKKYKIKWGAFDGSGDEILLTFPGYVERFVYDVDFLHAEKTSVNKILGGGNSLNNLKEFYPETDFTESYFSGFDKKMEGMDWKTLRLVFRKNNDQFYLVAVVHDQWTV